MEPIVTMGLDLAMSIFQIHAVRRLARLPRRPGRNLKTDRQFSRRRE